MSLYNYDWSKKLQEPEVATMTKVTRGKQMDNLLYDLLTTVSPYGKEKLISDIILEALAKGTKKRKGYKAHLDVKGNLIVRVGDYKKSKVMFSSHMDTVQSRVPVNKTDLRITDEGYVYASYDTDVHEYVHKDIVMTKNEIADLTEEKGFKFQNYILMGKGKTKIVYGSDNDFDDWVQTDVSVTTRTSVKPVPSVLGADDKLGCYIMCRLIMNGTPGLYVFHIGEECGGVGSSHISEQTPEIVKGMNYCIAFDRYEYGHIITHQAGGRCCSDDFANGLAAKLNPLLPPKQQMAPNTGGSFTDSANYTKLIPECTNVSVSYKNQHTQREHFDLVWFRDVLMPALLTISWDDLPVARDPKEEVSPFRRSGYYGSRQGSLFQAYSSNKSARSVVSTRGSFSSSERMNQSTIDKCNHLLDDKFYGYDPEDGLPKHMSDKQKADFVKYSIVQDNLTIQEIAELIVETEKESTKRAELNSYGLGSSYDSGYWEY